MNPSVGSSVCLRQTHRCRHLPFLCAYAHEGEEGFVFRTPPVSASVRLPNGSPSLVVAALAVLLGARAVMSAILPLSADEAYYWLWSRHLAAGYYDQYAYMAKVCEFLDPIMRK